MIQKLSKKIKVKEEGETMVVSSSDLPELSIPTKNAIALLKKLSNNENKTKNKGKMCFLVTKTL